MKSRLYNTNYITEASKQKKRKTQKEKEKKSTKKGNERKKSGEGREKNKNDLPFSPCHAMIITANEKP